MKKLKVQSYFLILMIVMLSLPRSPFSWVNTLG